MILNEREIHRKTIERYGAVEMINKCIQEMQELAENLRDNKHGADNIAQVLEERVDVEKMLNKLDVIFGFKDADKKLISNAKMRRTLDRLDPGNNHTLGTD